MASRRYKSFVFRYQDDSDITSIKHQKLATDAPIVPLLAATQYSTASKLESFGNRLRHVELMLNGREQLAVIPYNSTQLTELKTTIQQIAAIPNAVNPRYVGETNQ